MRVSKQIYRIAFVGLILLFVSVGAEEPKSSENSSGLHASTSAFNPGEVILKWTAPGNDGYSGQAAGYDLRYHPAFKGPIEDESTWLEATRATGEPSPSIVGGIDSIVVHDLMCGEEYYFCIKTYDFSGNFSVLSNSPNVISGACAECLYTPGDVNGDGMVNLFDITFLITFLYKSGPSPHPLEVGDVDGSGDTVIFDVTFLISHLYKGGASPVCMLWQF